MSTLLNVLERFVVVVSEKCKDILARGKQQTSRLHWTSQQRLQISTKLQKTSKDFKRLRETSRDSMRLHGISRDFRRR
jgi:hypothetical protein